jgi:photosystem II stability/assembly factor-like uncharacterized protein
MDIEDGLHDIEVIDEKHLVAYGYGTGSVYKTTDGGKTWDQIYQFDSIYFEQIQFLDSQNGWIAGSPNKIYRTRDGGHHWIARSLEQTSTEIYIYGMYFSTPDTGIIAAIEGLGKGSKTKIYRTTDRGYHWKKINEIPGMILNLENIRGILYGSGHNMIIADVEKPGEWQYCFQDTTGKTGQIRDIGSNGINKLLAVSFNGYVIKITDDSIRCNRITKNRIRSIASFNNNGWIAVGDKNKETGNLFISEDNGNSWKSGQLELPDIHRITRYNDQLWVVGKEGLIMKFAK